MCRTFLPLTLRTLQGNVALAINIYGDRSKRRGKIGGGSRTRSIPRKNALGQACKGRAELAKYDQDRNNAYLSHGKENITQRQDLIILALRRSFRWWCMRGKRRRKLARPQQRPTSKRRATAGGERKGREREAAYQCRGQQRRTPWRSRPW